MLTHPVPLISPVTDDAARPVISVMIPTYQPTRYLLKTLRSVLNQDLGKDRMQIAIVDDASPSAQIESLVAETATPGRVEIHRITNNLGLAGNWNRCISLSRGETVHILHQDDLVHDGFYKRLLPAFSHNKVGMTFCRHAFIDENDRLEHNRRRERWTAGVLRDWLTKITSTQRIQCASYVVKRSVYERLGGYRQELCYALDWDMCVRIAATYEVWYEPKLLASYRRHSQSETSRLEGDGRTEGDMLKAIDIFATYLPSERREHLVQNAYRAFSRNALRRLQRLPPSHTGNIALQLELIDRALDRLSNNRRTRYYRKQLARMQHSRNLRLS